jgi:outer membrane protein assembly factor BamE (lipoprotein component of BamABCDE complex)
MVAKVLIHGVLLKKLSKWTCVLSIVLLGACATVGKPFDDSQVKDLKKGVTTKLQVLEMLGLPFKEEVDNKIDTWTYFEKENALFSPNLQKDLVISFDKNNVVKFFRYASTNP